MFSRGLPRVTIVFFLQIFVSPCGCQVSQSVISVFWIRLFFVFEGLAGSPTCNFFHNVSWLKIKFSSVTSAARNGGRGMCSGARQQISSRV